MSKEEEKLEKIHMANLSDFKTKPATIRHALLKKSIYLPDHRKGITSTWYMKEIIAGKREVRSIFMLIFKSI